MGSNASMSSGIEQLVAKYLKQKGYNKAFQGLCEDVPDIQNCPESDDDLEKILNGIRGFMSDSKAKEAQAKFLDYPDQFSVITSSALPTGFVVGLCVIDENVVVSTADKLLRVFSLDGKLLHKIENLHGNSAIRTICKFNPTGDLEESLMVTGGMNGDIAVSKLDGTVLAVASTVHSKFVNSVDVYGNYIASVGYDKVAAIYQYDTIRKELVKISETSFDTIPTCVRFLARDDIDNKLVVLIGRLESSSLFMYSLKLEELKTVKLFDAEFGSLGNTFSPMYLTVDSTHQKIAVATDHTPFMRILIVDATDLTIKENFSSFTPQNQYSVPQISWSHDDNGVWTISDTGVIRGLDIATGRIVSELKGHDDRVRAIAVASDGSLVSGGADKRVLLWK